jgi:hypothetical protein
MWGILPLCPAREALTLIEPDAVTEAGGVHASPALLCLALSLPRNKLTG